MIRVNEAKAEVRGVVVDREGRPIPGAVVHAERDVEEGQATCDDDGRFAIDVTRGAEVYLWTEPPGYAPRYVRIVAPADHVIVEVMRESILIGRVIEQSSNRPVPGVDVSVNRGLSINFAGDARGTTDSEGRFRIGGLESGRYEPRTYPLTWRSTRASFALGAEETSAEVTIEVERRPSVRGRVALPEAVSGYSFVWLVPEDHCNRSGTIGAEGSYEVPGVDPGRYAIEVHAGPFIEALPDQILEVEGTDIDGLDLSVIRGARISGVVVDDDGAPIVGASVMHWRKSRGFERKTDETGRFTFEGIRKERVKLEVRGPEGGRAEFEQMIEGDIDVRLVLPRATRHAKLIGRIIDAGGRPVDRAQLETIYFVDGRELHSCGDFLGSSDGSFAIDLRPGHYALVPERYGLGELRNKEGGSARIEIDLNPGETREIGIDVEPLDERIEGRVVDGTGKPFSGVSVAVARQVDDEDQYGNAMFLARNEETCGVITDGKGRFTIDRLGKGRYTVVAYRAEGEELTVRDVDVGQRVTLMLDPPGAIAGRVVDRNGQAVGEVEVHARATLWFERTEELRTENGALLLDGLSPGGWCLDVLSEEGSATLEAVVRSNRTTDIGTIEVAPFGIVRGRVVDSTGEAVVGIGVVAGGMGRRSVHVETDSEGSYELRFPAGDVFISVSPGLRGHARGQVPADGIVELPAIQIESR